MSLPILHADSPATGLRIGYEHAPAQSLLGEPDVLAVIGFGTGAAVPEDARVLRVGLEPLQAAPVEVWRVAGPTRHGRAGALRWSCGGDYLFVAIELEEDACGGITAASEHAYRSLIAFVTGSPMPHLLRLWNYLDAINLGDGDAERYRLFCAGRARGMRDGADRHFPAATAIGRQDGVRTLQVYGLASRHAGTPVENPRQVSAWHYPRRYGPIAPTFARGTLTAASQLLISGTAAVVGHVSQHPGDLAAQVGETWENLHSLAGHAGVGDRDFPARSLLKVYLRNAADAGALARMLAGRTPAPAGLLTLAGDICRRELLVEIDGAHRVNA